MAWTPNPNPKGTLTMSITGESSKGQPPMDEREVYAVLACEDAPCPHDLAGAIRWVEIQAETVYRSFLNDPDPYLPPFVDECLAHVGYCAKRICGNWGVKW